MCVYFRVLLPLIIFNGKLPPIYIEVKSIAYLHSFIKIATLSSSGSKYLTKV